MADVLPLVNGNPSDIMDSRRFWRRGRYGIKERYRRDGESRSSRFVKAELKRAGVGYKELAHQLSEHGLHGPRIRLPPNCRAGRFRHPSSWQCWRFWNWRWSGWRIFSLGAYR